MCRLLSAQVAEASVAAVAPPVVHPVVQVVAHPAAVVRQAVAQAVTPVAVVHQEEAQAATPVAVVHPVAEKLLIIQQVINKNKFK